MGLIFELEESSFAGYIEDGEIYQAQLIANNVKDVQFPSEPEPVKRLGWKFRIISDDHHDGQDVWGETSTNFTINTNCKLYVWAEALLGQQLPPGYRLDMDTLVDRTCRIIVGKREYTDKKTGEQKFVNFVKEVHPSREAMAAMAGGQDEPF